MTGSTHQNAHIALVTIDSFPAYLFHTSPILLLNLRRLAAEVDWVAITKPVTINWSF